MIKRLFIGAFCAASLLSCTQKAPEAEVTLKDYFGDKFLIGVAVNVDQSWERDTLGAAIVKKHFNSVVAENCMKSEEIHPTPFTWNWDDADQFVKFGEENGMTVIGHCLIWHSQCSPWFFTDENGKQV